MNKCAWLLLRRQDVAPDVFRELVLHDVPKRAGELIPSTEAVYVTPQEPDEHCSAVVTIAGRDRPFDALLEAVTSEAYVPLDGFHEYLRGSCALVQGMRVHSTVAHDATSPPPLCTASPWKSLVVFIERRDGTSPEYFDRQWYIHAGHSDGREAENDEARSVREAREQATPQTRYVQNRILEPITPMAWVAHGYAQISVPEFAPSDGTVESREACRRSGEEAFDRWPPRMLQGYEWRII